MPPRVVAGIIVAFWLATTGYLVYREWWPWLNADTAPPFTVDLADEAAPQYAQWSIWRGGEQIGSATTRMTLQKDDTFELYSTVDNLKIEVALPLPPVKVFFNVAKLTTTQMVTREGRLKSVQSNMHTWVDVLGRRLDLKAEVSGVVRDGHLHARSAIDFGGRFEYTLDPIPLESGSMLNPLQPVARVKVRPGQRWRITNVDPLAEALNASLRQVVAKHLGGGAGATLKVGTSAPKTLLAQVLSETKELDHKGAKVACHVIEYRSDDVTGTTWVQADNGKVLRQEVSGPGEKMVLVRED